MRGIIVSGIKHEHGVHFSGKPSVFRLCEVNMYVYDNTAES